MRHTIPSISMIYTRKYILYIQIYIIILDIRCTVTRRLRSQNIVTGVSLCVCLRVSLCVKVIIK